MIFLVVENLDDSDQFILGRDFVRNFDVMIDVNSGLKGLETRTGSILRNRLIE